jgi:Transposase DNA-binding/Transposase DDE domain
MKLNYSVPISSFLGDLRLDRRFIKIINGLSHEIGKSISHNLVKWSQIKATYRFMSNKKVTHHNIMAIEEDQLIKQLIQKDVPSLNGSPRVVLHMQDTTVLAFSKQKSARQLPCLNYLHHRGYFAHTGILSDDAGCLEGVLRQDIWGRDEAELGTNKHFKALQNSLPIECKESARWVSQFEDFQSLLSQLNHTHGISISDRESDIYELFIAKRFDNVDLIVRSQYNRDIVMPDGSTQKLEDYLSTLSVQNYAFVDVLKEDKHSYRSAKLAICFGDITVKLPESLKWSGVIPRAARRLNEKMANKNGLNLRVVEVKEVDPEEGCTPIHWTILTTLPVNDYWDALQVTRYYALRWRIEIFHLVLKEGCAIEDIQLQKPQRIQNAIALYSLIAVKVTNLRYLAQTQAQKPMTVTGFTHKQYIHLNQYLKTRYNLALPTPKEPNEIPTVEQFIHLIVCLAGGHRGNKNKQIGIRLLWQGMEIAETVLQAFEAAWDLPAT